MAKTASWKQFHVVAQGL